MSYFRILLAVMCVLFCYAPAKAEEIMTVKTETFEMDYFKFGHGRKNFVIIPGVSVQSVMKSAQAISDSYKILTEDFTVYVMDRRKDIPPSYSVYDMARDTAEALRALNLDNVYIFGASQGGMIAMKIAIDNPELVKCLILGSTSARLSKEDFKVFEDWIKLAKSGNAEKLYLSFGEKVYSKSVFEKIRGVLIESAKTVTAEELKHFIIIVEGGIGFDVVDDLEKISCPVLIIGAKDDEMLDSNASAQIMEHLSGKTFCELFIYDGYGHAAYDVAPDYKERILKFANQF